MSYGDEEDALVVTPVESFEEVDDTAEAEPNRPVASVTQTLNDQDEDDNAGRNVRFRSLPEGISTTVAV